ncbi:MAG TPA: aminoglycoside phosphotransferase family protein [Pseudonocardiaceae bacterium]
MTVPAELTALVSAVLPGRPRRSVVPLGAGLDNTAYLVDDELVVRVARTPDAAEVVRREAGLLALVATVSPLPIPRPCAVLPERGVFAYPLLPGRPLLRRPSRRPAAIGESLGRFLAALHAVPAARVAGLAEVDDAPPGEWLDAAAESFAEVAAAVPHGHRVALAEFLAAAPPAPPPADGLVLCHHDLGAEHLLADSRGTLTGVIDWTDAALADPAHDLGLILRDLGPAALAATLRSHATAMAATSVAPPAVPPLAPPAVPPVAPPAVPPLAPPAEMPAAFREPGSREPRARSPLTSPATAFGDPAFRARVLFHARCALVEDLAHGIRTGDSAYSDKSLAAVPRLFATN